MARRTKEEAQETRRQILLAALDIFSEKGYSRTTFVDIAKRIGMTKGAVYWHFEDKPSLLAAVIAEMRARERMLVAEVVPTVDSLDDLKDYLMAQTCVTTEDELCRKFVFFVTHQMEWSVELMEAVRDALTALREHPFEEIEGFLQMAYERGELREEVDVEMAKDTLLGAWRGLIAHHLSGLCSSDLVKGMDNILTVYIASIRA